MGCYLDPNGSYYEGDRQPGSIEVPQRPTGYHVYTGGAWAWDLGAVRQVTKDAIKAHRDVLLLLTPFNGKQIQTDLASKLQIMAIASQSTLPASAAEWRTADDSSLSMTLADYQQLYASIMQREGAAFATSKMHQDAVDAMTDGQAILDYDYSGGWPA